MNYNKIAEKYGAPDFQIGFFQCWVHNQPYPDLKENEYDRDLINVTIYFDNQKITYWDSGTFMLISSMKEFINESSNIYKNMDGIAGLSSHEPNVAIKLTARKSGKIEIQYNFQPDYKSSLKIEEEIDQSYLPEIIKTIENTIKEIEEKNA